MSYIQPAQHQTTDQIINLLLILSSGNKQSRAEKRVIVGLKADVAAAVL